MNHSAADHVPIAAAVIVVDGRLFRRAVAEGALVWQFPAGKVEPGESAEDAAVREAGEETGLTAPGPVPGQSAGSRWRLTECHTFGRHSRHDYSE
jgi:8-oxo-dGTP pyrophosphatase MutT (NUDIX family)